MANSSAVKSAYNRAPAPHQPSRLPSYLTLVYGSLIAYASLHPFSGWRDAGLSPFAFLDAAWPRYWTGFDLVINALAYLPFGFFFSLAARRLPGKITPYLIALFAGTLLSLFLEAAQTWLPSRVPSNLDFASNSLGSGAGALLSQRAGTRFVEAIAFAEHRMLAPIRHAELGLVLVGLWLLAQLSPETLLFGTGDLRYLFDIAPAVPYSPHSFIAIETAIIVFGAMAIGLLARSLLATPATPSLTLAAFFLAALTIRSVSATVLIDASHAFTWFTPGAAFGLLIGWGMLAILLMAPHPLRIALASLALMASTVLVNITPANPYSVAAMDTWRQGHFLNFNGVTRLAASLWPFLTLPYLLLIGRQ